MAHFKNIKRRGKGVCCRETGASASHIILVLLLAGCAAAALGCAGCSKRRPPGEKLQIEYSVARPDLITSEGVRGIPEDLAGVRTDSVRVCGNTVWFGLYNKGLAGYDRGSGSWSLVPVEYPKNRELVIVDIQCDAGKVYAAVSSLGIVILVTESGKVELHRNPAGDESNYYRKIARTGNTLWAAGDGGLYTFDVSRKTFSLDESSFCWSLFKWNGNPWALCRENESERLFVKNLNIYARRRNEGWELPPLDLPIITLFPAEDSLAAPTLNGIAVFKRGAKAAELSTPPEEFPRFLTTSGIRYGDGFMLGTQSGLVYYNQAKNKWLYLDTAAGMRSGRVICLDTAGDEIYVGTEGGPFIIRSGMLEEMFYLAGQSGAGGRRAEILAAEEITARRNPPTSSWVRLTTKDGLPSDWIVAILPVEDDVWIGTRMSGLTRLSTADMKIENYQYRGKGKQLDPTMPVSELARDGDVLWHAGYQYYGRFSLSGRKWLEHPKSIGDWNLPDADALYVDHQVALLGVRKEGLRILDRSTGRWEKYKASFLDISPFITDIVRAGDSLILSMDTGLRRYKIDDGTFKAVEAGVFDVESLSADGDNLWIGARERSSAAGPKNTGLYRYNLRTRHLTAFNTVPGVRGAQVNKVAADGPFIWVASKQGLERYCRLSGEWRSYTAAEGLSANNFFTLAVQGNSLFVGTDNGLFVKTIRQFDTPAQADLYQRAWKAEAKKDFNESASLYMKLAACLPAREADLVRYRAAACLEKAGKPAEAMAVYEKLLADHPLLLLDIESVFSTSYGMDTYLRKVEELKKSSPAGSRERALCAAHLENIDISLKTLARIMERNGNLKKAVKYWKLTSMKTGKEDLRKEALANLRELRKK